MHTVWSLKCGYYGSGKIMFKTVYLGLQKDFTRGDHITEMLLFSSVKRSDGVGCLKLN